MKVLLANDTRCSNHPGCSATVTGLLDMLGRRGMSELISWPVGFASELLAEIDGAFEPVSRTRMVRRALSQAWSAVSPAQGQVSSTQAFRQVRARAFSTPAWERLLNSLRAEPGICNAIDWCDTLVVNGEGTIHHNGYRAQVLLALVRLARERNRRVWVVNATIEAMDRQLIDEGLRHAHHIAVRDVYSLQYLQSFGLSCVQASDAAFAAPYWLTKAQDWRVETPGGRPRCLISAGDELGMEFVVQLINGVQAAGYQPVYCWLDEFDRDAYLYCRRNAIPAVRSDAVPWQCFPGYIKQFDLCVSGRHHLNVFCLVAGLPFVALPANTWKVEGTLNLVQYTEPTVGNLAELANRLARGGIAAGFDFAAAAAHAKQLANRMLDVPSQAPAATSDTVAA